MEYPTWRYHRTEPARVIHSAEEEAEGWVSHPSELEPPAPAPAPVAPKPNGKKK